MCVYVGTYMYACRGRCCAPPHAWWCRVSLPRGAPAAAGAGRRWLRRPLEAAPRRAQHRRGAGPCSAASRSPLAGGKHGGLVEGKVLSLPVRSPGLLRCVYTQHLLGDLHSFLPPSRRVVEQSWFHFLVLFSGLCFLVIFQLLHHHPGALPVLGRELCSLGLHAKGRSIRTTVRAGMIPLEYWVRAEVNCVAFRCNFLIEFRKRR